MTACVFTREDLLEEFRKFSVEIRNLHQNLQQELQNDLYRTFRERSELRPTPTTIVESTTSFRPAADLRKPKKALKEAGSQESGKRPGASSSLDEHAGSLGTSAPSVSFAFGESTIPDSTDEGRRLTSREAHTIIDHLSDRLTTPSSNDDNARVSPCPAEPLRGAAVVSGFGLQDSLQPPSCVPLANESPHHIRDGSPRNSHDSTPHKNVLNEDRIVMPARAKKRISWSDDIDDEGDQADEFSPNPLTTSIGTAPSWLPDTYKTTERRPSQRSSLQSDQTALTELTSYSEKAKHIQSHKLRRQDTDMTEYSSRHTIFMVYNGDLSKSEAAYLFFKTEAFDYFMGIFLFANALSIGLQVEVMCHIRDEGSSTVPTWLRLIDFVFCIIFLSELLIRITIWRGEYLRMPGWQWNLFDILVVGFSVIDEITKQFLQGTAMQETIDSMGVLRMLRLARVVRLIRMVRLIPELKSMVYLILSSMWSFFWTLVLLTLLIYVVAVYYTEASIDLILKAEENAASGSASSCTESDHTKEIDVDMLKEFYGSIFSSFLSLFMAITGGDDWRNFVDLFKPDGSYILNVIMFVIYISFVTLVMLNLVTGVFVEGAQRIVQADKEAEITKNVRKLFKITDSDGSGEISWAEFEAQLDTKRMKTYLDAVDMNPSQAKGLFKLLDTDCSGELSVDEFVEGCLRLRVPARSVDLQTLKYDFEEITNHWASQFALLGAQIANIVDMVEKLAHVTVASLPEELILV